MEKSKGTQSSMYREPDRLRVSGQLTRSCLNGVRARPIQQKLPRSAKQTSAKSQLHACKVPSPSWCHPSAGRQRAITGPWKYQIHIY